jgi:hypothetical protein
MEPGPLLDKYRMREIEQTLAAELQAASEQLRLASSEEEKRNALEFHLRAVQQFRDFAAKGIVPERFLRQSGGQHYPNGSRAIQSLRLYNPVAETIQPVKITNDWFFLWKSCVLSSI